MHGPCTVYSYVVPIWEGDNNNTFLSCHFLSVQISICANIWTDRRVCQTLIFDSLNLFHYMNISASHEISSSHDIWEPYDVMRRNTVIIIIEIGPARYIYIHVVSNTSSFNITSTQLGSHLCVFLRIIHRSILYYPLLPFTILSPPISIGTRGLITRPLITAGWTWCSCYWIKRTIWACFAVYFPSYL